VDPLSRLIASGTIGPGDVIQVEKEGNEVTFHRVQQEEEGVIVA
jgi:hypothetical protein